MKEYNYLEINGTEYTEISRISYNNKEYALLSNLDNPTDFIVQKVTNNNEKEQYSNLDSEEEFNNIMQHFLEEQNK